MTEQPVGPLPVPAVRRFGRVNWRGLATLYRREVLRCFKHGKDTILGPAVGALLFMLVFEIALGSGGTIGSVPAGAFVAPGLILIVAGQRAFDSTAASLLFDRLEGIIVDVLMPPLTPLELTAGYLLAAATTGIVAGLAVALALAPLAPLAIASWPLVILFGLLATLLHAAFGLIAGLWAERWDGYNTAQAYCVMPLGLLSGSVFAISSLPGPAQSLIRLNPVFYAVDGFRRGFIGAGEVSAGLSAAVLTGLMLALALTGHRLVAAGYKLKP